MATQYDSQSFIPGDFPPALAEEIRLELSRVDGNTPELMNPGRLRAICRRAAGLALRAIRDVAPLDEHGSSAVDLLETLAEDRRTPSDVAAAATRLRAKREGDDTSAMSADPLADLGLILRYCTLVFSRVRTDESR